MKITTKDGFSWDIDENIGDDWELMELLCDIDDKPLNYPKLVTKVLGKEGAAALKEHLRDKKGKVSWAAIDKAMTEIFGLVNALKN